MSEKAKNITLGVLATLLVLVGAFGIYERVHTNLLGIKVEKSSRAYDKAKQAYDQKFNDLKSKALLNGASSKNPVLQSIAANNNAEALATSTNKQFFQGLYNFNSTDTYKARKDKLKIVATDDVLNNKDLFGTDQSAEAVSALQLTSSFQSAQTYLENIDGNKVVSLVRVTYTSGYSGSTPGTGIRTYEMTYDKGPQKITDVKLINSTVKS